MEVEVLVHATLVPMVDKEVLQDNNLVDQVVEVVDNNLEQPLAVVVLLDHKIIVVVIVEYLEQVQLVV